MKIRSVLNWRLLAATAVLLLQGVCRAGDEKPANPFIDNWALTIPSGGAGWLGVHMDDGKLKGDLLWGGGSVVPVKEIKIEGDTLTVMRSAKEGFTAKVHGDDLDAEMLSGNKAKFTGKRTPPMPPAPDLSFALTTSEADKALGGPRRELCAGAVADLVAVAAPSVADAVVDRPPRALVLRAGRIAAERGVASAALKEVVVA